MREEGGYKGRKEERRGGGGRKQKKINRPGEEVRTKKAKGEGKKKGRNERKMKEMKGPG